VLYGFSDRLFGFSAARGGFEEILHPSGARLKLLGQLEDGAAAVQVLARAGSETNYSLAHYNGKEFRPRNSAGLEPVLLGALNFLHTAKNGDLWIGGASGLARFHRQTWQTFPQPDGVFSLVELEGGRMWFGGRNKIHQYDGKTWQVVQSDFDRVNAMVQSRDGSIWVAVGNGLYRFYRNSWIYNAAREGLPFSTINFRGSRRTTVGRDFAWRQSPSSRLRPRSAAHDSEAQHCQSPSATKRSVVYGAGAGSLAGHAGCALVVRVSIG
jgi:hypothetical protein